MITFIVPIKSKAVSSEWKHFEKLVERTLKSICNQLDDNFRVLVICHEKPEIVYDKSKVYFHQANFSPPSLTEGDWEKNRQLKEADKANKILIGIDLALNNDTEYIMVVDSDDCISSKISSYVNSQKDNKFGWFINRGYYYTEGKPYIFIKKRSFYGNCGSGLILKTSIAKKWLLNKPFFFYDHQKIKDNDIKLAEFPHMGAIYSVANGENHFMAVGHATKVAKSHLLFKNGKFRPFEKLSKYMVTFLSKSIRQEFGLYKISNE